MCPRHASALRVLSSELDHDNRERVLDLMRAQADAGAIVIMTTHDPDTGERDLDTLRAIKEYRGQSNGKDVIFGVWGEVEAPGVIRVGDQVRLLD